MVEELERVRMWILSRGTTRWVLVSRVRVEVGGEGRSIKKYTIPRV
jgi:hypothetical protein